MFDESSVKYVFDGFRTRHLLIVPLSTPFQENARQYEWRTAANPTAGRTTSLGQHYTNTNIVPDIEFLAQLVQTAVSTDHWLIYNHYFKSLILDLRVYQWISRQQSHRLSAHPFSDSQYHSALPPALGSLLSFVSFRLELSVGLRQCIPFIRAHMICALLI